MSSKCFRDPMSKCVRDPMSSKCFQLTLKAGAEPHPHSPTQLGHPSTLMADRAAQAMVRTPEDSVSGRNVADLLVGLMAAQVSFMLAYSRLVASQGCLYIQLQSTCDACDGPALMAAHS